MSEITRNERKELDALSKDVYGVASRWQKLIEKGHPELVTEEVEEEVPSDNEGEAPTTRKVQKPVLKGGIHQYTTKRYTAETVKAFLLDLKRQLDAYRVQLQAQQEKLETDKKATELASNVHTHLSGSAKH